nr:26S proteasome non-ATPase regulatory subunit 14 homolog [Tanacetum cinerariifolium]
MKEESYNISEKIFTRRLELQIQLKGGMGGQSIMNLWFFVWRNILHHILGEIPRVGFNLEEETIILWWRYKVNEFIGELIKITPIGRRKWVDRKIKDERSIKRRIRMSSGTATTDLYNMIFIENFIFWKRNIRMSSGTDPWFKDALTLIAINYKKYEFEEKMTLNLHKKKWTDGLTVERFDTHSKINEIFTKAL